MRSEVVMVMMSKILFEKPPLGAILGTDVEVDAYTEVHGLSYYDDGVGRVPRLSEARDQVGRHIAPQVRTRASQR